MGYFDRLKAWYARNFVRIDQLRKYVELGALTKAEFKEITGTEFDSEEA